MAFINTVATTYPGNGQPSIWIQRSNVATNTGNTNVTLPASGSFSPPIRLAYIRVKTLTIGVNATVKVALITITDSTNANNVVQIYPGDGAASAAGVPIDQTYDLGPWDVTASSVNVVVNVATNNCTHDVEIAAGP
jgi:hypothetical protein